MSYIKTIREAIDAALDKVQSRGEALELQATLGKMELQDRFGKQFKDLKDAAETLHDKLLEAGFPEEEIKAGSQRALDELKVQIALGLMESREGVDQLKQEVTARVGGFNRALDNIDIDKLGDKAKDVEQALKEYVKKAAGLEAELDARKKHLDDEDKSA